MPSYLELQPDYGTGGGSGYYNPPSWELYSFSESATAAGSNPALSGFQMIFRDLTADYPGYTDFVVRFSIFQGAPVNWLSMSGTRVNQDGTITIYPGSTDQYNLQADVAGLAPGFYTGSVVMRLFGIDTAGTESLLSEQIYDVRLTVQNMSTITTDRDTYELQYIRSTGALTGNTVIALQGNTANENFTLSINQNSNLLTVTPSSTATTATIGKGSAIGTLAPSTADFLLSIDILNTDGFPQKTVFAHVTVLDNEDISVNTAGLTFSVIKSANETKSAELQIINPANVAFTITGPFWLSLSATSGSAPATVTVTTANPDSLAEGTYNDNITITGGGKTINVPVTLSVINFITSEFTAGQLNFCLDKKMVRFYRINETAKFLRLSINAVFAGLNMSRTIISEMQAVYFNNRCFFDVGEKIHNYFPRILENMLKVENTGGLFNAKLWFKPAEVTLVAEELDEDYKVLRTETLPVVKMLPGKKPSGFPWLTNHLVRSRVADSDQILSFVSGLVNPQDISGNYSTVAFTGSGNAATVKIGAADGLVMWPAVKTFTAQGKELKIYTRDPGPQNISLQWINQNLMPEYLSISGEYRITSELEHLYERKMTAGLEKFDVEKSKTIALNTGFLLKAEKKLVEELAESKICYFRIENTDYRGFLLNSKVVGVDSSEELIQYDLEIIAEEI